MKHALDESPRRRRHVWRWVLAALLVVVLAVSGWVWSRAQNAVNDATEGQGGAAIDILMPKALTNEGSGRVNILLAGSSFDDTDHDGATLTDSIILASMDLETKHVVLISIPRDLWVQYNNRTMKINAVFPVAAHGTQGVQDLGNWRMGMYALGSVVERVTGLHVDQYALVGYTALKDAVDAVGGIDVTIATDDPRGIYDPNTDLKLPSGQNHLDGTTALKLARARNHKEAGKTAYGINSDWGRGDNQRMILMALMQKAKASAALANPATLVSIFDTISVNVRTDLTVSQIRRAYDLSSQATAVKSISIKGDETHELLANYADSDTGADAIIPAAGRYDYSQIWKFVEAACAS